MDKYMYLFVSAGVWTGLVDGFGWDVRTEGRRITGGWHRRRSVDVLVQDVSVVDQLRIPSLQPAVTARRGYEEQDAPTHQLASTSDGTAMSWESPRAQRTVATTSISVGRRNGQELVVIRRIGRAAQQHCRTQDRRANVYNRHLMIMTTYWRRPRLHSLRFAVHLLYNKQQDKSTINQSSGIWAIRTSVVCFWLRLYTSI